jgi:hypothetical protein
MRKYLILFLVIPVCGLAGSCAAPAPPATEYNLVATIKDIMDSQVDPSADYIWESIGTEVSAAGIVDKRPQNADEWKEERRKAMLLVEAANLLIMPGRKVAKAGEKAENPEVELGPEEIEALINKDRPAFLKLAKEFQETAIEQLKAVDDKNVPDLLKAGGDLDTRCENCHKTYWYPNDPAFKQPAPGEEKGADKGSAAPSDKGNKGTEKK